MHLSFKWRWIVLEMVLQRIIIWRHHRVSQTRAERSLGHLKNLKWPFVTVYLYVFACVFVCADAQSCLLQPHGLQPVRLLYPWDFPGKNTWVGCHFLLQGIFPTQESNLCLLHLLHCRQILYHWATWEVPVHAGLSQILLLHKVPWLFFHPSGSSFSSLHAFISTDGAYFLYTFT